MGPVSDEKVNQYLRQTRDLFGDEIYVELDPTPSGTSSIKSTQKPSYSEFPSDLSLFNQHINQCHKCELGNSRTNFVFGLFLV